MVGEITPFNGDLPDAGDPASFDMRANALMSWLVNVFAPQLSGVVSEVQGALDGAGDAVSALSSLQASYAALGNLSQMDLQSLSVTQANWHGASSTVRGVISPKQLNSAFDNFVNARRYVSNWLVFENSQVVAKTHGLGALPLKVYIEFQAKANNNGFVVGEVIQGAFAADTDGNDEGVSVAKSNTELSVIFGTGGGIVFRRSGGSTDIRADEWKFRVVAEL